MATDRVMRTEYYEPKLGKWVALYEGSDMERARDYMSTPVCGNPSKRVAEYDKTGARKARYNFVREIAI